jgi:lysophospholipase L1-like esterase
MTLRFLALGDSYTIGEAVAEAQRWPVQLAALLRARGVAIAAPEIVATTGWTTDELAAGIDAAAPRGPYDLVSLLIGVNDQYRGRSVEEFVRGLEPLLARAVAFAGGAPGRVLVLAIPDWGVTPFADGDARGRRAIGEAIDAYNAAKRAAALAAGARWVSTEAASRRAADDPALTAQDGLHPSGLLYAEWADLALPAAMAAVT